MCSENIYVPILVPLKPILSYLNTSKHKPLASEKLVHILCLWENCKSLSHIHIV